ncbi:MAG: hypothetical protein U0841_06585 [Chloroflexia bacterium]
MAVRTLLLRTLLAGAILLVCWLLLPQECIGCTGCGGAGAPIQSLNTSDVVFRGTVTEVKSTPFWSQVFGRQSGELPASTQAMVLVSTVWKGPITGEYRVLTGSGGGDCGYEFKVGQEYLIYADHRSGWEANKVFTSICASTMPISAAAGHLAVLGPGTQPTTGFPGTTRWFGHAPPVVVIVGLFCIGTIGLLIRASRSQFRRQRTILRWLAAAMLPIGLLATRIAVSPASFGTVALAPTPAPPSPHITSLLTGTSAARLPNEWEEAGRIVLTEGVFGIDWSSDSRSFAALSGGKAQLWRIDGTPVGTVGGSSWEHGIAWSPDGALLATFDSGEMHLWTTAGERLRTVPQPSGIMGIAWSPDGQLLAVASPQGIELLARDGTLRKQLAPLPGQRIREFDWSPDGRRVVGVLSDGRLQGWNLDGTPFTLNGGQPIAGAEDPIPTLIPGFTAPVRDIAWSPDGVFLATLTEKSLRFWPLNADGVPIDIALTVHYPSHLSSTILWSPTSQFVAVGYYDGGIEFWDSNGNLIATQSTDTLGYGQGFAWSPDGTMFVTGDRAGIIRIWR